jgi:hypothetical protein
MEVDEAIENNKHQGEEEKKEYGTQISGRTEELIRGTF